MDTRAAAELFIARKFTWRDRLQDVVRVESTRAENEREIMLKDVLSFLYFPCLGIVSCTMRGRPTDVDSDLLRTSAGGRFTPPAI